MSKGMCLASMAAALIVLGVAMPAAASSLSGVVVRAETGTPVAHAAVEAYLEPVRSLEGITTTDASGAFSIDIPAGRYRIILRSPPLFDTTVEAITLRESQDFHVAFPLAMEAGFLEFIPRGLTFDPKHQARVRGVVMEIYTDRFGTQTRPLQGVSVSVLLPGNNDPVGSTTTDASGRFAIGLLPPGSYLLKAERSISSVLVELAPGSNVLVADPIVIPLFVIDERGERWNGADPCRLFQPRQTADIYIVCATR